MFENTTVVPPCLTKCKLTSDFKIVKNRIAEINTKTVDKRQTGEEQTNQELFEEIGRFIQKITQDRITKRMEEHTQQRRQISEDNAHSPNPINLAYSRGCIGKKIAKVRTI